MAPLPYKGGGLLMPFEPELHLFAVMNDPCPDKLCLVVMVTTIKKGRVYDSTCVLDVGDHPFITHPSYLLYRRASQVRASQIADLIGRGLYIPKEDFGTAVFGKIVAGLYSSQQTKKTVIKYADALRI